MTPSAILGRAFLAGTADLERRAPLVDRINVFPIVDADTGTNMIQTLRGTRRLLDEQPDALLDDTGKVVALLLGDARGNSGVIFSQFVAAFLDTLAAARSCGSETFAQAFEKGRELAYRAVAEPVEGTILSTITAASQLIGDGEPIATLDAHGALELDIAASVARTPEQMPRLKEAGVVDSGALGFHIFAAGLTLALPAWNSATNGLGQIEARIAGGSSAPLGEISRSIARPFLQAVSDEKSAFRYCTNLLIELERRLPDDWQRIFEGVGASVEVATQGQLARLHLHCNDPEAARRAGRKLGVVVELDTEDMTEGLVRARSGRARIGRDHRTLRVVGDSSMSLPYDIAGKLGATRIENHVQVHGEMVRDRDLDRNALYARMREGQLFTTAQTSAEDVRVFIDEQLACSDLIFYTAVGSAYTGTQSLVAQVVSSHPDRSRVSVFDTGAAAGQQGLICLASARAAANTEDKDYLIKFIKNQISTCREYLVIDNMKYLSRSGRIGRIKAAFAGALGVHPIVGHGGDGAITVAKPRSHESAAEDILGRVRHHPGDGPLLVMIEHTDNRDWAEELGERFRAQLPTDAEIILTPLSATSAVHLGPGTWGVAVTRL